MNALHPLAGFDFTPRDVLAAIRRYALRGLLVFLAVLAAGAGLYAITPVVHESQAAILVRIGRESVYRAEVGTDAVPLVPTSTDRDEMVNTQIQLFRSRDAITATIEAIGLAQLYPQLAAEPPQRGMDIARRRFDRSLRVTRSRASAVVQLAFRHPDPVLAQTALGELLQQQRRLSALVFGGADIAFYDTSVEQAELRLAETQRRLAAFQAEQGVLAFSEQLPLLLHQRQDLLAARRDVDAVLAGLEQRLAELEIQLARIPREVVAWETTEQSRAAEGRRAA